ncbi:MAG TPA: hypothetical protein VFQ53_02715 [Kofleriaceae bacterium]|nr:hypothetical protein [Kofleriaceae bacterium]
MSAAPLPKSEPEAPEAQGDAEGWALLEGLRRRLDDQAALGRKTQQQVSQLTESIAALVEVQRQRSRRINLNSFVAYLIFTMLCGAGFYFLYRSRANELLEARDHATKERDLVVKRADELAAKTTAREQADAKSWEVYQLLEAGKRNEATAKLAVLRDLPLSRTERAILAAKAHETQVMEVDAALKAAATAFKAGRHADVIAPLEAALVSEPAGARAAEMQYLLGIAYAKTGALDKAIVKLQAALDSKSDHEDTRFQLASALDRSGAYAKARAEYDRFATAYPQNSLAIWAMRRSAALARMPANAPPPPAPNAANATNAATGAGSGSAALPPKPPVVPPKLPPKPPAKPATPPPADDTAGSADATITP